MIIRAQLQKAKTVGSPSVVIMAKLWFGANSAAQEKSPKGNIIYILSLKKA